MRLDLRTVGALGAGITLLGAPASAQYFADFEAPVYTASAAGDVLTGQDDWYLPPATTSVDFLNHTYTGNTLGFPQNPAGGEQFAAGVGPATASTFARAEREVTFGTGLWQLSAEVAVSFQGMLPTQQNIGSLSTQPATSARLIMLARWTNLTTADAWNADLMYFNAAGGPLTLALPDPAFQNLEVNTWYRWTTLFDFNSNRITRISIENIATGEMAVHEPVDFYLTGGSAGAPAPTAIRMFAGNGSIFGNAMAFDNVFVQEVDRCYADCTGELTLDIFDFLCFQDAFVVMDPYADCDMNTIFDIFDFLCFQDAFVTGCAP